MDEDEDKVTIFDNYDHAYSSIQFVLSGHRIGTPPGSFANLLIEAIIHADGENRRRLAKGFPVYVQAFHDIQKGE